MATAKKKVVPAKKVVAKKVAGKTAVKRPGFGGPRKPGARPAVKRKPLPQYQAPPDFKPHFLLVSVQTEADGLFGNKVKATRYQGKFARDAEDKKKADMADGKGGGYDQLTVAAIMARLSGKTFKPSNDKKYSADIKQRNTGGKAKINGVVKAFKSTGPDGKPLIGGARLPKNTMFQLLLRVGRRTADNNLTCTVKQVFQIVKSPTGRIGPKELVKTDPIYRTLRGCGRFLPAAFTKVQMPPKRTRRRAADIEGEDE